MMRFVKLQASGNDFILIDNRKARLTGRQLKKIAVRCCPRKFGIGADGLLAIETSKKADFKMRIFNPDGSEPSMCGNGARCVAVWAGGDTRFETAAGIVAAQVQGDGANINMPTPYGVLLDIPIKVFGRKLRVNFINTGVPHAVIPVEGLRRLDVNAIAVPIRYHKKFSPEGVNVNFMEQRGENKIAIRTYERGVENETLSCGSGSVAVAAVAALKSPGRPQKNKTITIITKNGETLRIRLSIQASTITEVWLMGRAEVVYRGLIG